MNPVAMKRRVLPRGPALAFAQWCGSAQANMSRVVPDSQYDAFLRDAIDAFLSETTPRTFAEIASRRIAEGFYKTPRRGAK